MAEAKTAKKKAPKRARKRTKAKKSVAEAKQSTANPVEEVLGLADAPAEKTAAKNASASTKSAKLGNKLEIYQLAQPASGERYFILANGQPIRHVAQLAEVLEDLEDHVFDHHVNPDRNDFATWVQDVFEDIELAKKMIGVPNKEKLQLVIYKHVAHKAFAKK